MKQVGMIKGKKHTNLITGVEEDVPPYFILSMDCVEESLQEFINDARNFMSDQKNEDELFERLKEEWGEDE